MSPILGQTNFGDVLIFQKTGFLRPFKPQNKKFKQPFAFLLPGFVFKHLI